MKKVFLSLSIIFVLCGCGSKTTYINGVCIDVCPSTGISYRTKEKVEKNEQVIIETTAQGFFKVSSERQYSVDFSALTSDDLEFYIKINTAHAVFDYKLNNVEKYGILHGVIENEFITNFYKVNHVFFISGDNFHGVEKTYNEISFNVVLKDDSKEINLFSNSLYSQLKGSMIVFSTF